MIAHCIAACILLAGPGAAAQAPGLAEAFIALDAKFGTLGATPPAEGAPPVQVRAFVRSRMKQDAFYDTVLAKMYPIFESTAAEGVDPIVPLTLKRGTSAHGRPYFYLDRPCPDADLVSVAPWWDLRKPVLICTKDYRPEITKQTTLGFEQFCEFSFTFSTEAAERRDCRCGKHLLSCAKDAQMQAALRKETDEEPIRTAQHVIQNRVPYSSLLTMQASVRGDFAELFYARNEFFQAGTLAYAPPARDAPPRLRPRPPEFAGGVLSTPAIAYNADNFRGVVAELWSSLLCTELESSGVDAAAMFHGTKLSPDLRYHERMELTEMAGCRGCHATLEYGTRPLSAFSAQTIGRRLMRRAEGPVETALYVSNPVTPAARGPATLLWLGQAMSRQPEFSRCTVRSALQVLYTGVPVPSGLPEFLEVRFRESQDFVALFEDATVARVLGFDVLRPPGVAAGGAK